MRTIWWVQGFKRNGSSRSNSFDYMNAALGYAAELRAEGYSASVQQSCTGTTPMGHGFNREVPTNA